MFSGSKNSGKSFTSSLFVRLTRASQRGMRAGVDGNLSASFFLKLLYFKLYLAIRGLNAPQTGVDIITLI